MERTPVIRHADRKDLPGIRRLLRSLPGVWQDAWREDVLERALDSAGDLAFVAIQGSTVVGFASAHDVGFRAYLSELAVSRDHQRQGIGAQLLRRIETALGARGCAVLIADVYPPAEPFYAELGWQPPHATLLGRRLQAIQHAGR
jgi:ribosomal protein S18 acetylase RimI-like enzyme